MLTLDLGRFRSTRGPKRAESSRLLNMGGKGRGKTGHGKTWKKPSQEEEKAKRTYLAAVKPEWALAKNSLRPYASEDSSPFFTGGKSDTKYWELGRIREAMAADTAELANRLGIALSESGGAICMGDGFDRGRPRWPVYEGRPRWRPARTGRPRWPIYQSQLEPEGPTLRSSFRRPDPLLRDTNSLSTASRPRF